VARRGVLNAAFTLKELRELTKIEAAHCRIDLAHFDHINITGLLDRLSRPRRRLTEYMHSIAKNSPTLTESVKNKKKIIDIQFHRTPVEIVLDNEQSQNVRAVKFQVSQYDLNQINEPGRKFDTEEALNSLRMIKTDSVELQPAELVVRSIGYKNVSIDEASVPFDKKQGVVPNERGRVLGRHGLYCTGWIKRGPRGVIVDTTSDAHETADQLCSDITAGLSSSDAKKQLDQKPGSDAVLAMLQQRGVRFVDKTGWSKIDAEERRRGALVGKPREKISSVAEMLKIANFE
jgi:adrenodoxin-NADP+ reductase